MAKLTPMMREVLASIIAVNDRKRGLGALFHPGFEDQLASLEADGLITSRLNGYFVTPAGRAVLADGEG